MPSIAEIRQKYPQYSDMSDAALAGALHRKFYSDMPRQEFDMKIGLPQVEQRRPGTPEVDNDFMTISSQGLPQEKPAVPIAQRVDTPDQPPEAEDRPWTAFGTGLVTQFANNMLAVPSAVGDALHVNPFRDIKNLATNTLPEPVLGTVPRVKVNDLRAASDTVLQAPGMISDGNFDVRGQFDKNLQARDRAYQEMSEANPVATGAGEIAGDVATLLTGRTAFGLKPIAKATTRRTTGGGLEGALTNGLKKIGRGGKKVAESGIEGAALATLNEGDPATAAALAAGGQTLGSIALTAGRASTSKMGFFGSAAALFSMIQLWKSMTPGGRDRILESVEQAYSELGHGLMIGAASALMGAGRLQGVNLSRRAPQLMQRYADSINTMLRGPWESMWSRFSNTDEMAAIEQRLGDLIGRPEDVTPKMGQDLQRALKRGDMDKVKKVIGVQ